MLNTICNILLSIWVILAIIQFKKLSDRIDRLEKMNNFKKKTED